MKRTVAFFTRHPFLALSAFLLAAYLPVFLPFFHLKNDLITQNLPTRFVISESLYSGYFPWWNPYINFGIPQYGDMNGGFWDPLLWLIARIPGYSIWTITLEEMTYILLGGWGIYLLCREQRTTPATAFLTAISYMGGGFILGHLQHFCWITGTAFFPYVLLYFIRIQKAPRLKNFIIGGLCVFLFLSSTHPGLVIGALYFFLFLHIGIFLLRKDSHLSLYHDRFWSASLLFLFISLLLSVVVLVSDLDTLPHISRGHKVSLSDALLTPTTLQSYISLLFPLAVQQGGFFHTDIAMRNTWIGLLPFAGFIVFYRRGNRKLTILTGIILLFFILLSAGSWFKVFAYHFLPLTGYVRLNGEFSYFTGLIMLLAGAAGLNACFRNDQDQVKRDQVLTSFRWLCLAAGLLSAGMILFTHASLLYAIPAGEGWKEKIKGVVSGLTFWDLLFIQSLFQWIFLALLARYRLSPSRICLIQSVGLMLTCWFVLPYTGLGMASKANRQQLITTFPKGIHAPEQQALTATRFLDSSYTTDLVLLGAYSKKIGYPQEEQYPVEMSTTESFFRDTALLAFIRQQSYIFLSKDTTTGTETAFDSAVIHITGFGPGRMDALVENKDFHYLTFLQNDHPYWQVMVDGLPVTHFTGFRTFLTIPLSGGRHQVSYRFDPGPVRTALLINIALVLAALGLLSSKRMREWHLISSGTSYHSRY